MSSCEIKKGLEVFVARSVIKKVCKGCQGDRPKEDCPLFDLCRQYELKSQIRSSGELTKEPIAD